jgi:hypothetical protein
VGVAAVAVVAILALDRAEVRQERRVSARARELLAEQQDLIRELEDLRSRSRAEPWIPLSLGEDYDLVLTLGPWLDDPERPGQPSLAATTRPQT